MARPLRPLISSGGYYPSRRWIPLVRGNGYTTQDGGEEEPGIWKTIKGALIHITDSLASPMQKCEVTLEPIQDLHGQDAPYPAGGGKNKSAPYSDTSFWIESGYLITDGRVKSDANYRTSIYVKVIPNAVYYFSTSSSSKWLGCYQYDSEKNPITSTGLVQNNTGGFSFTTSSTTAYVRVYAQAGAEEIQLEKSSSKTPFAPYSNICPITGWTGCEVTRTGQNIVSKTVNCYFYSNATHPVMDNNSESAVFYAIRGTTYVRSSNPSPTRSTIALADSDEITYNTNLTNAHTMSLEDNNTWVAEWTGWTLWYFYPNYSASVEETAQIEVGSTATDYEEPNITTLSVTFPDTVFGGSHEFVSGESIKTHNRLILKDLTWYVYQPLNSGGYRFIAYPFTSESVYPKTGVALSQNISNVFSFINPNTFNADTPYYKFGVYSSGTNRFVQISHPAETVEDLITSLTELDAILVYEVANPTEISLTPQEISTLRGENNVWSNSNGDTTITYKAQAE